MHPLGLHHPGGIVGQAVNALADVPFPSDRGFTAIAVSERRVVHEEQVPIARLRELGSVFAAFERFAPYSLVLVPMIGWTGVLGAVYVIRVHDSEPFSAEQVGFATVAGKVVALAVEAAFLAEALEHASGRGATRPRWQPPDDRPSRERWGVTALSERERGILAKLALGYTNKEVADQLALSVRTVEWHRARLQWKLGVSSRAELIRVARSSGLADDALGMEGPS
jgi:DNA-binding CsgD family transcriptional regulator